MFTFLAVTQDQLKTIQSRADQLQDMKWELFILLSIAILIGILNIIYYFVIRNSPDQGIGFLFPKLALGKSNVNFAVENNLGRPLNYSKCTIYKGEKVYKEIYPKSDRFSVYLKPGNYTVTVSKFGHTSASTDQFEVNDKKLDFNLTLKATEDVQTVDEFAKFAQLLQALVSIFFLAIMVVMARNYVEFDLTLQLIMLSLVLSSGFLSYRYIFFNQFIRAYSFKGHSLPNEKIEIFGHGREPLKKITTGKNGVIKLRLSPGIYKFSPERYSPRTIKIFETELGNFKVKF